MDLTNVLGQAKNIVTATMDESQAALLRNETREAKRLLTSGQRALRDLKREVTNAERDMRAEFQEARLKIDRSGQLMGAFGGSKTRGILARGRAADKRDLAARKAANAEAYRRVKSAIDDFLSQIDNIKFKIDSVVSRERDQQATRPTSNQKTASQAIAGPSVPPSPPPTPASWKADPFGRHELRYWDGARWTEHVADAGVQGTDQPDYDRPPD